MKMIKALLIFSVFVTLFGCSNTDDNKFIDTSGTIESTNVIISSRNAGNIESIKFVEGDKVTAGDTILIIDHELLGIQLQQAIASKDATNAQLNLMLSGARKEDINQAEQLLNQAKINFDLAEKDKIRMMNLFESKSITQKQYEDATARYELTQAQLKAAQDNYNKVKNIFRREEIDQAKANLDKAIAGIKLLQKNINDSYVTSPINGYLVKTFIELGETVTPMSSLFKVSDLDEVDLIIYVSEEELGFIKLGQNAEVTIDTYKDKIYKGRVTYISPEAEFTPKNIQTKDERTKLVFAVKISIPNQNHDLKPGMPADAVIKIGSSETKTNKE